MKPRLPRSIGGLIVAVATISVIVTTLLAIAATVLVHGELERQLDERIEIETHALLDYYRSNGFEALANMVSSREQRSGRGETGYLAGVDETRRSTLYLLVDARGQRRAGALNGPIPPAGWSEFVRFRRADGSGGEAQAMNSRLAGGGQLIVAADRGVIHDMHWKMVKLLAAAWTVIVLFCVAVAFGFGRVVRRRLKGIERSAHMIMAGDLSQRMPLDGSGGDFDRLSLILNQMLDRIAALLDNLRQVSGDIAHDLRTPLQRVRNKLEAAAKSASGTDHQERIETAIRETDDLLELFGSLLAISEIEGQSVRARFEPTRLDEAIEEIADIYRPAFEDEGRAFFVELSPIVVQGDGRLLQRVVANLLDNVLAHTPAPGGISIHLDRAGDVAVLQISDDGPGIPSGEHERVFRRLTRLDASRSKPGHGLGLSLVAAVVDAHRGSVKIQPSETGLVIRIEIPAQ